MLAPPIEPMLAKLTDALPPEGDWLFEPTTMAGKAFDPTPAIEFWDLTNRQDWHVCELQQKGSASRSWVAGRYSNNEPSVHAFDAMCADRYLGDEFVTGRTVRSDYGAAPKD